ncbi:hypothetical protein MCA0371 [Methylococcus capsulatus str. Bath]|uniref:Uncharacterized protein n=1 Tax=Methylococcus capsulatus (strain ATCC 33009 / NCIMB 11132 / Bath) TaxID=243233 RepID=Q60BU4_METCA|nr:hypothetical protein MCA0371 [Methylococcus capsulatus str. Bath]
MFFNAPSPGAGLRIYRYLAFRMDLVLTALAFFNVTMQGFLPRGRFRRRMGSLRSWRFSREIQVRYFPNPRFFEAPLSAWNLDGCSRSEASFEAPALHISGEPPDAKPGKPHLRPCAVSSR